MESLALKEQGNRDAIFAKCQAPWWKRQKAKSLTAMRGIEQ
jgi:hypothetical protein